MGKVYCNHLFHLFRAQYDPEKPLYVPPGRLILTSEVEFCFEVARVPVELYNEFLKTV